eukprot:27370_1
MAHTRVTRQQMKEQRQKWLNEYHEEKRVHSNGNIEELNPNMVHEITKTVSTKLAQKRSNVNFNHDNNEHDHGPLDHLIENELNFNCPICLEIMVSPFKEPLLLIPCSHTFCKECILRQKIHKMMHHQNMNLPRNSLRKCPFCREKIQSVIGNIQLRQLIDKMLQLKEKESQNLKKHIDNHQTLQFRKKILYQELKSAKKERKKLDEMMNSYQLIIDYLRNEEVETKKRYNTVKRELELIEKQLNLKSDEMFQFKTQRNKASTKCQLLQNSLNTLQSELDKCDILS